MKFYVVVRKLPPAKNPYNTIRFDTRSEAEEHATALCRKNNCDYVILKTDAEVCLQKSPVEIIDL